MGYDYDYADYDYGVVWWRLSEGLWLTAGIREKMC